VLAIRAALRHDPPDDRLLWREREYQSRPECFDCHGSPTKIRRGGHRVVIGASLTINSVSISRLLRVDLDRA
jgi:hypothetical protein